MFCFDPVINPIVSFVLCNYTQILVADRNGCNIRMVAIAWKIDKREAHNLFCEAYPSLHTFVNTVFCITLSVSNKFNAIVFLQLCFIVLHYLSSLRQRTVPCLLGLIPEAARALLQYAFAHLGMGGVWCGYYEGNEKSKRVQEKLGFIYQYTTENLEVTLMNETRTGHTNLMTKERWQKITLFRNQKKTLDTFLEKKAISQAQYNKSLGDLRQLMDMQGVE